MTKKIFCVAGLTAIAACANESGQGRQLDEDELAIGLYGDLIEKAAPGDKFQLLDVELGVPWTDLDDLDAAKWREQYEWAPSPGYLREIDLEDRSKGIEMAWNEQFGWPLDPNWEMTGPRPSLAVLEIDAVVDGRRVHYQSALIKDFPSEGDRPQVMDPVLGKLAFQPGPPKQIEISEDFVGDFVEWQRGPEINVVGCNSNGTNRKDSYLRAQYISSCAWAQDQVQLWFHTDATQTLSCGGPDATGQCLPSAHNFTGRYRIWWRRCDDPNGNSSDCSGENGWQQIPDQSAEHTIWVEWFWCADDALRMKNEFPNREANVLKSATDSTVIGHAGVQTGQSILTLDGDWHLELATIATGLTIAYYGIGSLYVASRFASWLMRNPDHTRAHRRIGPQAVAPGLKCATQPVCRPRVGEDGAVTTECPTPFPDPTPEGDPTPDPTPPCGDQGVCPTPDPTPVESPTPDASPTPDTTPYPTPYETPAF